MNNETNIIPNDMRSRMWDLKVTKGYTDAQIAREVGCTRSEVSSALNEVGRMYLAQLTDYAIGYKMQQVAQLETIIKEALDAWEWSKYHSVKPARGAVLEARAQAMEDSYAVKINTRGDPIRIRGGNSTYLKVAMDAMDRIKLLLNLGATHIIRDETKEAQKLFDSLSNEELNLIINGQYTIVDSPSTGQLPAGDYSEGEGDSRTP